VKIIDAKKALINEVGKENSLMFAIKNDEKETPETNINLFNLSCFTILPFYLKGEIAIFPHVTHYQ
jgi:hypothetical protein